MGLKEDRLVESVLFSAGKPLSIEEIKTTTGLTQKQVVDSLESLITVYNIQRKDETSIEIVKAGNKYAMQVKKKFVDQSMMVAKPEIKTDLLKTLALIAFHQPVLQSNLRHMVGEKIYEHVDELISLRLVNSKPHGSTELLTTSKLFPEYFGIDSTKPEEIREFLAKKVIGSVVADTSTQKIPSTEEKKQTPVSANETK
ncbi:MAG: SMC-Scp complex subunit ScpB [Candidatus Thermoplasmatota archaeon]